MPLLRADAITAEIVLQSRRDQEEEDTMGRKDKGTKNIKKPKKDKGKKGVTGK